LPLPYDDGPAELEQRGLLSDYICRQAELGRIYIKKIGIDADVLHVSHTPSQAGAAATQAASDTGSLAGASLSGDGGEQEGRGPPGSESLEPQAGQPE
jgi:hypothetical protein